MLQRIGHYTILSQLGRGGMGVVYKAHEESLNRFVAIKVLGEHLSGDEAFLARFIREARAAAALSHPNITQIYFIGQDQGLHYFAMEYVSGRSLQALIKEEGAIQNPRATQIIAQAAHGLAAAHDHALIHRDIKPANLVLDHRGVVKLLDFGIALPTDVQSRITSTGMLVGTPGYASPEQCSGEPIDQRTDIYALGVTFYEMLTGVLPFRSTSPLALLREIMHEQPRDIAELNPAVDEETRRCVRKMLSKDPADRYQSCHELITELEEYLAARGIRNLSAGLASATLPDAREQSSIETRIEATPAGTNAAVLPLTATQPSDSLVGTLVQSPQLPAAVDRQAVATLSARARSNAVAMLVILFVLLAVGGAAAGGIALFRAWQPSRSTPLTAASITGAAANAAETQAPSERIPEQSAPFSGSQESVAVVAEERPNVVPDANASPSGDAETSELTPRPATNERDTEPRAVSKRSEPRREPAITAQAEERSPKRTLRGVAISVSGDAAIESIVRNLLEAEVSSAGVEIRDGVGNRSSGAMLERARREGVATLIIAEMEQTGQRELQYMGRSDTAYATRVKLTAWDVASGKAVKRSSTSVEYTQLSAERAVEKALGRAAQELVEGIR